MPLAKQGAALRALSPSNGIAAGIAAKAAEAPRARGIPVDHVDFEIFDLFLANAPVADFLVAFQARAMLLAKAAATVLTRADSIRGAPVKKRA